MYLSPRRNLLLEKERVSHIVLRAWLREVSVDCRLIVFSDVPFPWWWLLKLNSEMELTIIANPSLSRLLSFKLSSCRTQMFYRNEEPLHAALTNLLLLPVLGLSANKKPLAAERRRYLDILGQKFQLSMWLSAQNLFFFLFFFDCSRCQMNNLIQGVAFAARLLRK